MSPFRRATRYGVDVVDPAEPGNHPPPVPPSFTERYRSDTKEGRRLRRLGKVGPIRRLLGRRFTITVLRGLAVHWEAAPPRADHSQCAGQVEEIRAFHKSTGYRDIAYSFLFCQHGQVFVGRGWGDSAATCGSPWNSTHASVCWMGGPGYVPSSAAYGALASVAREARARGATDFGGHRDYCSTQCPGNELYARVHSPALFDGGPGPAPQEDDPFMGLSPDEIRNIVISGVVPGVEFALRGNANVVNTLLSISAHAPAYLNDPGYEASRSCVQDVIRHCPIALKRDGSVVSLGEALTELWNEAKPTDPIGWPGEYGVQSVQQLPADLAPVPAPNAEDLVEPHVQRALATMDQAIAAASAREAPVPV